MRVKGFARTASRTVVNTDGTEYEIILRERARKRAEDSLRAEVRMLAEAVSRLTREVEALKRG